MDLEKSLVSLASAVILLGSSTGHSWGGVGHQVLAEVGAGFASSPFWRANEQNLGVMTNVPDRFWRSGKAGASEEAHTHFFEPDAYYEDPRDFRMFPRKWNDAVRAHGQQKLKTYGTAVWRFQQLRSEAIQAVLQGQGERALQMAGTMSHYLGDLSQPLHVTVNYDGQMTNQSGIHKFFETTNLNSRDYEEIKEEVSRRTLERLTDPGFVNRFNVGAEAMIFDLVEMSYSRVETLLDIDARLGRRVAGAERQYELALEYMADGAAIFALVLDQIASQSPNGLPQQTLKLSVPSWVAPDYSGLRGRRKQIFQEGFMPSAVREVECEGLSLRM